VLETQIAHQASSSSKPPGRLPSKLKLNPKKQCNAIVLRSDTQLEGPKGDGVEVEGKNDHDKGVSILPSKGEVQEKSENEPSKESKSLSLKPGMSPLLFPQRLAKANLDHQFGKFLDVLKKLHVNIPFIDCMPNF